MLRVPLGWLLNLRRGVELGYVKFIMKLSNFSVLLVFVDLVTHFLSTQLHHILLYWLGDLLSLNPVPSTIDSEPPPHQIKPNPLTTQRVKDNVQNTRFLDLPPTANLTLTFTCPYGTTH